MGRIWSPLQKDIFREIKLGTGNLSIDAKAGSGKTTTIVKGLDYTPSYKRTIYLAYNKHIALELETKVPSHVKVKTCHGFGLWALMAALKPGQMKPRIEKNKVPAIIDQVIEPEYDHKAKRTRIKNWVEIRDGVSLAKNFLVTGMNEMLDVIDRFDLVTTDDEKETLASQVLTVLQHSNDDETCIDFDDMIYLPILRNVTMPSFDVVFVDEAQDLNRAQIEMIARIVGKRGRLVMVGDPHQGIYAFRGADSNAMIELGTRFKVKSMPLSITYRCPQLVTHMAQRLVPDIQAAPNAPMGAVTYVDHSDVADRVQPEDMVLCRTNSPLVSMYFELLHKGVKAAIRGRNFGPGLLKLVNKLGAIDINDLPPLLMDYRNKEVSKLKAQGKTIKAQLVDDKVDTLLVLCQQSKTLDELEQRIDTMFNDDEVKGVILSSVHRSKGLEANRVWILCPKLIPHPMSEQDWEIDQEFNLAYVAITRAKCELIIVANPSEAAQGLIPDWAAVPDVVALTAHLASTKPKPSVVQDGGEDDVDLEEAPEEYRPLEEYELDEEEDMPATFSDKDY